MKIGILQMVRCLSLMCHIIHLSPVKVMQCFIKNPIKPLGTEAERDKHYFLFPEGIHSIS